MIFVLGDQPGCSRVNIVKVKHSDDVEKEDQTSLKGVDDSDKVINTILDELWRFAQTYTIRICKSVRFRVLFGLLCSYGGPVLGYGRGRFADLVSS